MYDLRIGTQDSPKAAIECVGAVDPEWTETWNVGPARGSWRMDLGSDWRVVLRPGARVKDVRSQIQRILRACEDRRVMGFHPVNSRLKRAYPDLWNELFVLEVHSINCYRTPGSGDVSLGLTGYGGAVDARGRAIPGWIASFLTAPDRADVLSKLDRSGADECHVYVPVASCGAPWEVESYLITESQHLPVEGPLLPSPVSRVWIAYGERGVRWDGERWKFFGAPADVAR